MEQTKHSVFHSFSGKLTAFIVLVAASVFVFAFIGYYNLARKQVQDESVSYAESGLSTTIVQINKILGSVEIAVGNLSWVIPFRLENPEEMYGFTRRLVEKNPFITSSSISFEPNYYKDKGYFYAPFAYRKGKDILSKQLGNHDYQYHDMEWYKQSKLTFAANWSEPYFDEGGGNILMTTYSKPVFDKDGKFVAVFTADVSLDWLSEAVNELEPYKHSFTAMIDKKGTFIAHPMKEKILKENIFTAPTDIKRETFRRIADEMMDGKQGMIDTMSEGKQIYVFYAPVATAGWSVALVCQQDEIFAGVNHMRHAVLIVTLIGLLVMSVLCYFVIRNLTNPLLKFTESVRQIAKGDFKTKLPDIHSKDEMRTLRDSFDFMQKSLNEYIEELKKTTAKKERIESELRIASTIQMDMIPRDFPPFPERNDIDLYAHLVPAKEVGGDLYDFFLLSNKLYFILGDVSGKGVPASMFMAVVCRTFRTVAVYFQELSEIVSVLNDCLAMRNESSMFCTAFIGVLNLESGRLEYCNAGHNPPFVLSSTNEVEMMTVKSNLPLGLFEQFPYETQQIQWAEGDSLFLYTDGVTEAENENLQLYSEERLYEKLKQLSGELPEQIVGAVFEDVHRHAEKAEQSDDITVMCLKYQPKVNGNRK